MTELHIVVRAGDAGVDALLHALEILTDEAVYQVESWSYHAHPQTAPPSGEIVGWLVVQAPEQRDFADWASADQYAQRTGGDVYPVFASEVPDLVC